MAKLKMTNVEEEKEILGRLGESGAFKKAESKLREFLGSFGMRLLRKGEASEPAALEEMLKRLNGGLKKICAKNIAEARKKSARSRRLEIFPCLAKSYGFSYPLSAEGGVFGYILAWGIPVKPPEAELDLFCCFVDAALEGIRKEMRLQELYKTVKPRAIALSTVHTIHRLISSSLYLDELLSRIARLSMQIIRANRCSIKLIDSKKKTLLPKVTVDLRKKSARLKKVKIGKWAPGKAFKYTKSIKGERYLATPLMDEDVIGVITLYDKTDGQPFNNFDEEIMKTLAEQAAIAIKNAQLYKEQEKLTMGSIRALAQIIESKGTGMQAPKSGFLRIVQLMGIELGMREHELKKLQYAALLHDAGELMVPEKVLRKRGKLTAKEYKMIKEHPLKGARIIKSLKSLKSISPIIMYHHENYDGTGYPKGLKGNEIPLGARIMAVVAAFDAMIAKRPYRIPISVNQAVSEIKKHSGRQFDPGVVNVFLKAVKRKDVIRLIRKERRGYR